MIQRCLPAAQSPVRPRPGRQGRGFTLIELMIVVAIVGILSVLAVYGVRKYIANAKSAEARNALGHMANSAVSEFENEKMAATVLSAGSSSTLSRALCKSSSVTVPTAIASVMGKKYQSSNADWSADSVGNSGFTCLHFTIDEPQYYMYSYTSPGTGRAGDTFTATANGDLNGDGVQSTFQITGLVSTAMVVNVAPNMLTVNENE